MESNQASANLGRSVASAGDVDGYSDVIIGANRYSSPEFREGGAFVYRFSATTLGVSYCTAGTSANGCKTWLSGSGLASAMAPSGFSLIASKVKGAKDGVFFFSTAGRQAVAWGNGTSFLCVTPPVPRAGLLSGRGTPGKCNGVLTQDLNALWCPTCPKPVLNPGAGALVQVQLWYRDPFNTSNKTSSLSDALEFLVAP